LSLAVLITGCAFPALSQPPGTAPFSLTTTPTLLQTIIPIASITPTITPTSLPLPTPQIGCTDSALYVEDVSIPDNSRLKQGENFTKTWRLRNTGKCIWNIRYALVFVGGDQMGAQVTTPLSETPPGESLDISVILTAPAKDGIYTGLYELRRPSGAAISIGSVTSIWVKIAVGNVSIPSSNPPAVTPSASQQPGAAAAVGGGPCDPRQNGTYTAQILSLINSSRAENKLSELNPNSQLDAAAQGHSQDMACNNFSGHNGSDGSTIHQRVVAAGYAPSYSEEIIYPGGSPQEAFNWWMNDKIHRDAILNPSVVDVGVGYIYAAGSAYGGYFTVDFAAP
jgi:uncharacterized protein YkwD